MEILNRNTFNEDDVTSKKVSISYPTHEEITLVYIGKNCYSLKDLENIIKQIKSKKKEKDFMDSLNYRVRTYTK